LKNFKLYTSIVVLAGSVLLFTNCKKYVFNEGSQSVFIPVEEKNSSLIFHYSSTTSSNSGGSGYTQFENYLALYDSTEVVLTLTEGNVGGATNDTIFAANAAATGVLTTSTFQANFTSSITSAIASQINKEVVANAAYKLEFTDEKVYIHTTTQFFKASNGEEFYLTPYLLVDSLVANQTGHPDGAATNHRKVAVDVGRLINFPVRYMGYEVASGQIDAGYRFNLDFEVDRLPSWSDPNQISVALIITKKNVLGNIVFVNANTNH
jgi:hypothetical protein